MEMNVMIGMGHLFYYTELLVVFVRIHDRYSMHLNCLRAVVPEALISVRYERPNEPVYEEGVLIDVET